MTTSCLSATLWRDFQPDTPAPVVDPVLAEPGPPRAASLNSTHRQAARRVLRRRGFRDRARKNDRRDGKGGLGAGQGGAACSISRRARSPMRSASITSRSRNFEAGAPRCRISNAGGYETCKAGAGSAGKTRPSLLARALLDIKRVRACRADPSKSRTRLNEEISMSYKIIASQLHRLQPLRIRMPERGDPDEG